MYKNLFIYIFNHKIAEKMCKNLADNEKWERERERKKKNNFLLFLFKNLVFFIFFIFTFGFCLSVYTHTQTNRNNHFSCISELQDDDDDVVGLFWRRRLWATTAVTDRRPAAEGGWKMEDGGSRWYTIMVSANFCFCSLFFVLFFC